MEVVIILGIGVFIGCVLMRIISRARSVGSLRVDNSDPEDGPYLFLELEKDVGKLYQKKYVILKINVKSFIPHE